MATTTQTLTVTAEDAAKYAKQNEDGKSWKAIGAELEVSGPRIQAAVKRALEQAGQSNVCGECGKITGGDAGQYGHDATCSKGEPAPARKSTPKTKKLVKTEPPAETLPAGEVDLTNDQVQLIATGLAGGTSWTAMTTQLNHLVAGAGTDDTAVTEGALRRAYERGVKRIAEERNPAATEDGGAAVVSAEYAETVDKLLEDRHILDMAGGLTGEDWDGLVHPSGQPRHEFMMAALHEYNQRGGEVPTHIGGPATALLMLLPLFRAAAGDKTETEFTKSQDAVRPETRRAARARPATRRLTGPSVTPLRPSRRRPPPTRLSRPLTSPGRLTTA
jgi:hypothetical protein